MNLEDEPGVHIVSFGERDLDDVASPEAHSANHCAVPLLSDIERCADSAARRRLWLAAIQKAGFRWLCYWHIQCVGERVQRVAWFDTYSPPGWLEGFRNDGFFDVDPRIDLARGRDWPFAWDIASLFANRPTVRANPVALRFTAKAAKVGVHGGVTVGLPTHRASERVIVTVSSEGSGRRRMTDTTMGEAYVIAVALHAFIAPRARHLALRPEPSALDELELTVLRLVCRGSSNREIAEHLAISTHAVVRHLRQLEQKCAARNRVQLAYLAGRILYEQQNE